MLGRFGGRGVVVALSVFVSSMMGSECFLFSRFDFPSEDLPSSTSLLASVLGGAVGFGLTLGFGRNLLVCFVAWVL